MSLLDVDAFKINIAEPVEQVLCHVLSELTMDLITPLNNPTRSINAEQLASILNLLPKSCLLERPGMLHVEISKTFRNRPDHVMANKVYNGEGIHAYFNYLHYSIVT